jgi:hypothetical protein
VDRAVDSGLRATRRLVKSTAAITWRGHVRIVPKVSDVVDAYHACTGGALVGGTAGGIAAAAGSGGVAAPVGAAAGAAIGCVGAAGLVTLGNRLGGAPPGAPSSVQDWDAR